MYMLQWLVFLFWQWAHQSVITYINPGDVPGLCDKMVSSGSVQEIDCIGLSAVGCIFLKNMCLATVAAQTFLYGLIFMILSVNMSFWDFIKLKDHIQLKCFWFFEVCVVGFCLGDMLYDNSLFTYTDTVYYY